MMGAQFIGTVLLFLQNISLGFLCWEEVEVQVWSRTTSVAQVDLELEIILLP